MDSSIRVLKFVFRNDNGQEYIARIDNDDVFNKKFGEKVVNSKDIGLRELQIQELWVEDVNNEIEYSLDDGYRVVSDPMVLEIYYVVLRGDYAFGYKINFDKKVRLINCEDRHRQEATTIINNCKLEIQYKTEIIKEELD